MAKQNGHTAKPQSSLDDLLNSGKPYSAIYMGVNGIVDAVAQLGEKHLEDIREVLARRIRRSVRGGDEAVLVDEGNYIIVIRGVYDPDAYRSLQSRIRTAVENDILIDSKKIALTVDFGYASFPEDGTTFDEVVEHAHQVMQRSEHSRERLVALEEEVSTELADELATSNVLVDIHADSLTGLPDAQYFRRKASALVNEAGGGVDGMTVVFCDIEKFKEYNLKHGYTSGDDLLKYLADLLVQYFPNALVARLNSDRFGILTKENGVSEKLEEIHEEIRRFKVSTSTELKAGICAVADANNSATTAQDYARLACDSIKGHYDVCWRRFDETLADEVRRRQHIVDNLDTAISQGWIEVYYQPVIRAVTGDICGLEALCRWNDPEFGMLPPNEFIDVLEDAHLIHKLDLCMVRKVCADGRAMLDANKACVHRSINLSRLDYQLCDIFTLVDEIVTEANFPKNKIKIEFTESAFTQDAEFFTAVIDKFRSAGYDVWMDDFGSGYSSLNLLKDYNFDMLKIDMAFLQGLETNPRTRDIVSSVVDMAKKLGIQTLAEGVETEQQYLFLKSIGCEMVQGYLFAKPDHLEVLDEWVEVGKMRAESDDVAAYYNKIGYVNMLSPSPFEHADERAVSLEYSSGIPLAIAERRGNAAYIVIANEPFLEVAHETEIVSSLDDQVHFNARGSKLGADILALSDRAKESGADEYLDFYNFKELFTLRMMHIAECGDRDAYLVSLNKYDTTADLIRNNPVRSGKSSSMVYLPERQVTPWQQSDEIDLAKTAIVVIDVLGGAEGVTPGLEDMAANCVSLVKAARTAGIPIIFNIDNHIAGLDHELELWGDHGVRGTESGTPLVEFEVAETDFIIPKRRYNGFFETDLELTLRELGVDTIIMVGADTNICVLQTLAGAYFYGYKTIVPADATATFLIGTQEAGLEYFARCYDTRIVTTTDIVSRIADFQK